MLPLSMPTATTADPDRQLTALVTVASTFTRARKFRIASCLCCSAFSTALFHRPSYLAATALLPPLRQIRHRPRPNPFTLRPFSAVTAPPRCEHIEIPCRSNASFTVDVFHAPKSSAPILIYLPSGPVLPDCTEEEQRVIITLAEASTATIVRINYRASSAHQYPTPCHDVLLGYDWVQDNLLIDDFKRPYLARLGVCGELVGGSLATMLALTECRLGQSRIGAAALNNPLVDWVFPDELPLVLPEDLPEPLYGDETAMLADEDIAGSLALRESIQHVQESERKPAKKSSRKPLPPSSWQAYGDNTVVPSLTLSGERDVLFKKPEDYFDRFASPIHFFRSPHAQLIYPPPDDVFASQQPDEILDMETQLDLSHYATFDEHAKPPPVPPALPVLSRSLPAKDSDRIPEDHGGMMQQRRHNTKSLHKAA
ncbi:hypothetical protein DDE82_003887 [Stemphylium lycopersici]|nr:hypothetical protein DDE82_003887 [Stemphylium lycopersici]